LTLENVVQEVDTRVDITAVVDHLCHLHQITEEATLAEE
jgi:hypothetical protein